MHPLSLLPGSVRFPPATAADLQRYGTMFAQLDKDKSGAVKVWHRHFVCKIDAPGGAGGGGGLCMCVYALLTVIDERWRFMDQETQVSSSQGETEVLTLSLQMLSFFLSVHLCHSQAPTHTYKVLPFS